MIQVLTDISDEGTYSGLADKGGCPHSCHVPNRCIQHFAFQNGTHRPASDRDILESCRTVPGTLANGGLLLREHTMYCALIQNTIHDY